MKVSKFLYGDDADGNRGLMMSEAELDDSEEERNEIAEMIANMMHDGSIEGLSVQTVEVYLEDDNGEEFEFSVDPRDYADEVVSVMLVRHSRRFDDTGESPCLDDLLPLFELMQMLDGFDVDGLDGVDKVLKSFYGEYEDEYGWKRGEG